ncbi:zinc metalloproteinase nas-15-like [Calliphora vicina]|uniref:zinc metalloproteinase nas-15-like n=1 Tax=Calliphora vicina TaxID=7373 RepID=UPI00325AB1A6
MKQYLNFVLLYFLVANCDAVPVNNAEMEKEDPELTAGFFEGDMVLDLTRNGVKNPLRTWPLAIVRYKIDSVFDADHKLYIEQAMDTIASVTCVRFIPATFLTFAYVHIYGNPNGCFATVGYLGYKQDLNLQIFDLDTGCFRMGSIIHELLHIMGFFHQQSASDRDDYVVILEENIIEGREHNFIKYDNDTVTAFGTEYDYGSIMHYGAKAFSKNGNNTIETLQPNVLIGQRVGLSETDIDKINSMYNCHV